MYLFNIVPISFQLKRPDYAKYKPVLSQVATIRWVLDISCQSSQRCMGVTRTSFVAKRQKVIDLEWFEFC